MKIRCVEWNEPWTQSFLGNSICATIRIKASDIITWQRRRKPRYESDQQALDDFLVVNWARVIEVEDIRHEILISSPIPSNPSSPSGNT
jgi:hypothetical protein